MRYLILFTLFLSAFVGSAQRDHQIILDPGMSPDTTYIMVSDSNAASPYYGRGMWTSKALLIKDKSPTNELQTITIDSSGASDPRTIRIGISSGNTVKFLDRAGGGVSDHGALTGLTDDDHGQYALLNGRSGGQTLIGGTGTTDDLIFRTTGGVGASGSDMIFQVGNNGATEALRIIHDGKIGIGRTPSAEKLELSGKMYLFDPSNSSHNLKYYVVRNGATQTYLYNELTSTESANMDLVVRFIPVGTTGRTAYQVWGSGSNITNGTYLEFSHLNTSIQFKSNKTGSGSTVPIDIIMGSTTVMRVNTSNNVGVGTTSINAKLHLESTTEQLRSGYNSTNYWNATTGSSGITTFDAVGSASKFVFSDRINIPTHTPSSASDTGTTGDIAWDSDYIYICVGTNTWKRTAISTW